MATLKTRSSTISQNSNVRLNAASTLEEPTEIPITNDISKENRNQLPPETAELKMFVQGNKISINTKAGTTNNDISRVLSTVSEESEKYEYNCEPAPPESWVVVRGTGLSLLPQHTKFSRWSGF